jgi:hypothetical protein
MINSKSQRFARRKVSKTVRRKPAAGMVKARQVLEDRIRQKLASYSAIRHLELEWGSAVEAGTTPFDLQKAKRFQSLYEDWMGDTEEILKGIRQMVAKGLAVAGTLDFRDTVGFCPAGIDIEETLATFKRLERGEGVVVHEVNVGKIFPCR